MCMHTLLRISDRYEEAQDIVTAAGESIVCMLEFIWYTWYDSIGL